MYVVSEAPGEQLGQPYTPIMSAHSAMSSLLWLLIAFRMFNFG